MEWQVDLIMTLICLSICEVQLKSSQPTRKGEGTCVEQPDEYIELYLRCVALGSSFLGQDKNFSGLE